MMHRIVSSSSFLLASMAFASSALAQNPPGQALFEDRCGTCHGADGNGGEHARAVTRAVPTLEDAQLTTIIREGLPARGMPPVSVSDVELPQLLAFVRTLRHASPMAYQFDGQEYIAIASGGDILAFGLVE